MCCLQAVDFLVDGTLSVGFGIVEVDLKSDMLSLLLKISTQPDGRCGSEAELSNDFVTIM